MAAKQRPKCPLGAKNPPRAHFVLPLIFLTSRGRARLWLSVCFPKPKRLNQYQYQNHISVTLLLALPQSIPITLHCDTLQWHLIVCKLLILTDEQRFKDWCQGLLSQGLVTSMKNSIKEL